MEYYENLLKKYYHINDTSFRVKGSKSSPFMPLIESIIMYIGTQGKSGPHTD